MVRKQIMISGTDNERIYIDVMVGGVNVATIRGKSFNQWSDGTIIVKTGDTHQTVRTEGYDIIDVRGNK